MAAVLYWRLVSRRAASLRESGYHPVPRLRIANNFPFTSRQLSLRYTAGHGAASSQAGTGIDMGPLLSVPLLLLVGYTISGGALPLVGKLTKSASQRARDKRAQRDLFGLPRSAPARHGTALCRPAGLPRNHGR